MVHAFLCVLYDACDESFQVLYAERPRLFDNTKRINLHTHWQLEIMDIVLSKLLSYYQKPDKKLDLKPFELSYIIHRRM